MRYMGDMKYISYLTHTHTQIYGLVVKNLSASAGDIRDVGLIPGLGRPPRGEHDPLQYPYQENPMDRGA